MKKALCIEPDFKELLQAYTLSKVFRLGVAFSEGTNQDKAQLAMRYNLSYGTLRKYGRRAQQYGKNQTRKKERWHYSEDNYLMANYQFKRLPNICEGLPNRTRNAIVQRAIFLGVAKERKAFTN